ncbi:hypothetical protein [Sinorhizobium medicae]|uniref:hypothetical protein n=1 Tax=Sinorhizobium medicae TaxID=110321 RepID=UPI003969E9F8
MTREATVNLLMALLLLGLPLIAAGMGEPFYVTLATRVVVLALAAVGLNLALGLGGLLSFGHAAFFGPWRLCRRILATHAFNAEPLFCRHSQYDLHAADLVGGRSGCRAHRPADRRDQPCARPASTSS